MGFLEALLLAFIILKLAGVITWSWWLVFTPLYPSVLIYLILAVFGVGVFRSGRRRHRRFDRWGA